MKLGTQTASMTNHLYSRAVIGQPEPEVGMGATILMWTDRHAATVAEIVYRSYATLVIAVQEDTARRTDTNGMSECQSYSYEPNPRGRIHYFRRRKNGTWQEVTRDRMTPGRVRYLVVEGGGSGLRLGERSEYHDFSF